MPRNVEDDLVVRLKITARGKAAADNKRAAAIANFAKSGEHGILITAIKFGINEANNCIISNDKSCTGERGFVNKFWGSSGNNGIRNACAMRAKSASLPIDAFSTLETDNSNRAPLTEPPRCPHAASSKNMSLVKWIK